MTRGFSIHCSTELSYHSVIKARGQQLFPLHLLPYLFCLVETGEIRTTTVRDVGFTIRWAHSCPASPLADGREVESLTLRSPLVFKTSCRPTQRYHPYLFLLLIGKGAENRTRVNGFGDHCVATTPHPYCLYLHNRTIR